MLEGLHKRELGAEQLLQASDHLTACADCRERLTNAATPWGAVATLRDDLYAAAFTEDDHLSEMQVLTYIKSRVDDIEQEIVESHLDVCTRCAEIARDVRRHVASPPARRFELGRYTWPLAAAAMIAIAIGSGWLFSLKYRGDASRLEARLGEFERSNEELRGKLAAVSTPQTIDFVATLTDAGRQITLDRDGRVSGLPPMAADQERLVGEALKDARVKTPSILGELAGRRGQLLGPSDAPSFAVLQPAGEIVESQRPTFRWRRLEGAESYIVRVYDSRLSVVATSDPRQTTAWSLPVPLARGHVYGWNVTANKAGREITSPSPPAPEARFRVISGAELGAINQARRDHKDSHLILGLLYARSGLIADAEREMALLAQANPDSQVVKKLLLSIGRTRR